MTEEKMAKLLKLPFCEDQRKQNAVCGLSGRLFEAHQGG